MKNYQKLIYVFIGMILMGCVSATIIPVMASMAQKQISVLTGAQIYIDDIKLNPVDGNGKPVEVFIYNGTTYLPVRAISNAFNKAVVWEGKSSSVFVGKHSSDIPAASLEDMEYFYTEGTAGAWWSNIKDVSSGVKDNLSNIHYNGLFMNHPSPGADIYNINQKYSRFKGAFALYYDYKNTDTQAIYKIYGDDTLLFQSPVITKGAYPAQFDIDVTGVVQLKIQKTGGDQRGILSEAKFYN
jgi:hypothetical protein